MGPPPLIDGIICTATVDEVERAGTALLLLLLLLEEVDEIDFSFWLVASFGGTVVELNPCLVATATEPPPLENLLLDLTPS